METWRREELVKGFHPSSSPALHPARGGGGPLGPPEELESWRGGGMKTWDPSPSLQLSSLPTLHLSNASCLHLSNSPRLQFLGDMRMLRSDAPSPVTYVHLAAGTLGPLKDISTWRVGEMETWNPSPSIHLSNSTGAHKGTPLTAGWGIKEMERWDPSPFLHVTISPVLQVFTSPSLHVSQASDP